MPNIKSLVMVTTAVLWLFVPRCARGQSSDYDEREDFLATFYSGLSLDSFAAAQLNRYLNNDAANKIKYRYVGGFDFAYRLLGDQSDVHSKQLWAFGETVYGVRSADVDCSTTPKPAVCEPFNSITGGERTLFILRNASSLEVFAGARWEFATFREDSKTPLKPYLKGQFGFLSVTNSGGDLLNVYHAGAGGIIVKGPFQNSYFELGIGRTDVFKIHPFPRFKVDSYLAWQLPGWKTTGISAFAQMTIDKDIHRAGGADSTQTYIGLEFDLKHLFHINP